MDAKREWEEGEVRREGCVCERGKRTEERKKKRGKTSIGDS